MKMVGAVCYHSGCPTGKAIIRFHLIEPNADNAPGLHIARRASGLVAMPRQSSIYPVGVALIIPSISSASTGIPAVRSSGSPSVTR